MIADYTRLWELLKERHIKLNELINLAGISKYVIYKMKNRQNITTDILGKICSALHCTPNDIMEFTA